MNYKDILMLNKLNIMPDKLTYKELYTKVVELADIIDDMNTPEMSRGFVVKNINKELDIIINDMGVQDE